MDAAIAVLIVAILHLPLVAAWAGIIVMAVFWDKLVRKD